MIYSRQNILSLQFRSMTTLRRLTRMEFLTRLQVVRVLEPVVKNAFKVSEDKIWRGELDSAPHGEPWHVSFHASQFPGNNPMACARQSLYRMMNFPESEPTSRLLRQTADQGKQTEVTLVQAFENAGILLSSADPFEQTKFEYPDAWLTGTVDSVIEIGSKAVPVEVKNRSAKVIQEMKLGRGPFDDHVRQIKTQIGLLRQIPVFRDVDHGIIYYVSRDNPLDTAEFHIDYDEAFWKSGIETLKRWRAYFEEDMLPEIKPGKRGSIHGHPNGWRWSYAPCNRCDFKKTCQLDFRESCTTLSESRGIDRAKKIRPNYDVETVRLRVRARWQTPKPVESPAK